MDADEVSRMRLISDGFPGTRLSDYTALHPLELNTFSGVMEIVPIGTLRDICLVEEVGSRSPVEETNGEPITKEEWGKAFGTFTSQSDGAWQMTPEERCRAKCRQKERERGVRRIDEHTSIVPSHLVDEFGEKIEAWMNGNGDMSEMPMISCGKVVKFGDFPSYELTIEESPDGGPHKVTTKFVGCKDEEEQKA